MDAPQRYSPGYFQSLWPVDRRGQEALPIHSYVLAFSKVSGLLTAADKMLSNSQQLAEMHEALNYEFLAHARPAEYFPVNYA